MHKPLNLLRLPLFVVLLGIYPALSLLGHNISEVQPWVVLRPLLFSLVFALVVWGITALFIRDLNRSGIISAVVLVLFFAYGHLYNLLAGVRLGEIVLGRHRYLLLFEVLLLLGVLLIILRARRGLRNVVQILNVIALVLVVFPLAQIVDYQIRDWWAARNTTVQVASAQTSAAPATVDKRSLPDIYYIILDMYTRDDVLKDYYLMDNQPFLDALEAKGFYIGRCSKSNYAQTQLSLTSSLNMNYLEALGNYGPTDTDRTSLDDRIEHNAVRTYLETLGYKTVSLSAYAPLKIESAAVYFSTEPDDLPEPQNGGVSQISPFEAMFINDSALMILTSTMQAQGNQTTLLKDINYPFTDHIRQQLYILETVKKIPQIPGPKFVFVHIQIPHPPLVFGPNGEIVQDPPPFPSNPAKPISLERTIQLYSDQVLYINKRILELVTILQSQRGEPPIILLQGDHGALIENRMPVLNAYSVPDALRAQLYPSITPVNSFRMIFNNLFGANFPLLEDHSYYSDYSAPYQYVIQPETRPGCVK